jgi:hypothetical protein
MILRIIQKAYILQQPFEFLIWDEARLEMVRTAINKKNNDKNQRDLFLKNIFFSCCGEKS